MDGKPAIYLGRIVSKNNFRTYVYGTKGEQKLVESWREYENHMETGLWFASLDDVESLNKASELVDEQITKKKPGRPKLKGVDS